MRSKIFKEILKIEHDTLKEWGKDKSKRMDVLLAENIEKWYNKKNPEDSYSKWVAQQPKKFNPFEGIFGW